LVLIFSFFFFPQTILGQENESYDPNSFIIKFKSNILAPERASLLREADASDEREIFSSGSTAIFKVQTTDVQKSINILSSSSNVEYVEPNYYLRFNTAPNDPMYGEQYHLPNIKVDKAWDITRGSPSIYIADVDSGILESHPDLADKIYKTYNLSNGGGMSDKRCPHGTAVAGTFGATTNNSVGVAGVGYNIKIIAIKINSNARCWIAMSDEIEGIRQAANSEAQVINLSLGGPNETQAERNVIQYALDKGKIIVASAGNNSNNKKNYPAAFDGVISVAASNASDKLAPFSSFGSWVDLVAPGADILTLDNNNDTAVYAKVSGTSFSSPVVAGVVALMKSKNQNLTATQITDILCNTADKIEGTGTKWRCGKVNAEAAVKAAGGGGGSPKPTSTPKPTGNPTPTPTPSTSDVYLKFRFQGIDTSSKNQNLTVKIFQNSIEKITFNQESSADDHGLYQVRLEQSKNNLIPGSVTIKIKGGSHLQRTINNVIYSGPGTTIDLTTKESEILKAGDTTNDNKITIDDVSNISRYYTDFSVPVNDGDEKMKSADITKDGVITIQDLALASINWSDLTVTGDE